MNRQILKNTILVGIFTIPFVPFLVSGSLFFPFITTKAFAWRFIVEIVFAVWVVLALLAPEFRLRRSPILYAVLVFLLIVGLADLFGVEPMKSFWSNFERMEGFVTMLHLGALSIVMGSVLREREWNWWWNTTLVASAVMVLYSLLQLSGSPSFPIHQGGVRVDGTIGNASYLALYFLIHIFVAIFYFVKSRTSALRWTYGTLILGQVFILYHTATRGAILGLIGGLILVALLGLINKQDRKVRKISICFLIGLAIFITGFLAIRNTSLVKNSQVLNRFSTLSPSLWKTEGRAFIWPMALKGIGERPLLGWGQDNFNYVFAEHYSAKMYNLEPWFDRAHNIFLDWAVAAGILGLGAYLSLYGVLLWTIWKRESLLSHMERSVLTGLIVAYFFNNIFVFDNLVSYVLFFSLFSYMHSKIVKDVTIPVKIISEKIVIATSIGIALLLIVVIYFVNVKPLIANTNLIMALQTVQSSGSKATAIGYFEKAYASSRLGRPEVVEWVSSSAPTILSDETIPMDKRNAYFEFAKNSLEVITKELSGDPRYELVAGSFYSSVGGKADALRHFEEAKKLMREKQLVYFNLGQMALIDNNFPEALSQFKTAYDLAPGYDDAKMAYLVGAIYARDSNLVIKLLSEINPATLISDPRALSALYQTGQKPFLLTLLRDLVIKVPQQKDVIEANIKQIESGGV
ncbi:MAG: O-antigen ligase family protein [Patescibacteria group bacterium]